MGLSMNKQSNVGDSRFRGNGTKSSFPRKRESHIFFFFTLSIFALSCSNDLVFSEVKPVPDKTWTKQTEFQFHFEIRDTTMLYDISLQLRNSNAFPYQNIWILFEELHPVNISIKDTLEYRLVDDYGKWTGNGISLFQNQFPIIKNRRFPDTGAYTINIRHGMRDDFLKGIEDIGILIVRH